MTQYNTFNVKLSNLQLITLGRLLGPLLIPLGLIATTSATDAAIHQKMCEERNDIMKIVKSLKESGLLIKGFAETIKNEAKELKVGFLNMLLGKLGASFIWNTIIR